MLIALSRLFDSHGPRPLCAQKFDEMLRVWQMKQRVLQVLLKWKCRLSWLQILFIGNVSFLVCESARRQSTAGKNEFLVNIAFLS